MVQLEEFDAMPGAEAEAAVRTCADVDSWVTAVVAGRPYADRDALLARAAALADDWTDSEVDRALADHPRIGERPREGSRGAAHSRREQAAVGDDVTERLAEGNRRYEARFGRIYLVRAAGRTGEELLAILEERLGHDDETERRVTRQQLGEIALLRLEGLVQE